MEAEENQKQVSLRFHSPWKSPGDFHIPTARRLLFQFQKGALEAGRFAPPPGSFLDENMLNSRHCRGGGWSWHRQPEHRLWHRATPRIGH